MRSSGDIGARCGDVGARRGDVRNRTELLAIYWRGVTDDIGDCGVGVTPRCVTELLIMEICVLFPDLCCSDSHNNVSNTRCTGDAITLAASVT